jgi:Coenzyme PQQ synthesis protein D (PqqD)
MPPVKPKVRADLAVVEVDGEAIVYDDRGKRLHHLNPTATIVFGLCDGRSTIPELSGDIAEAFGLPPQDVERQVRALLRQFRQQEFLEPQRASAEVAPNGRKGSSARSGGNGTGTVKRRSKERTRR